MHAQEDKNKLPSEAEENQENQNINEPEKQAKDIEQKEEAKLRMKYPGLKAGGGSFLAQKRLSRGQKYFDSGDYAMAKAKTGGLPGPGMKAPVVPGKGKFLPPGPTTGDVIPTPESLPPRKPSLIQSKLASGNLS